MAPEESLKNLKVVVKGGGSLISHRPVFSSNSEYLFVIASSTIYVYSTASGLCLTKFQTPSASTIVNIKALSEPKDLLLLLTSNGEFAEVDLKSFKFKSIRKIELNVLNWVPITHLSDFIWPSDKYAGVEKFFVLGYPADNVKPVLYSVTTANLFVDKILWNVMPHKHSVACGQNGRFIAAIQEESLFVKDFESNIRFHKSGTRRLTCVAIHPHEWVCATGDDSGRVVIWTNVLECVSPAKTIYHWHTLPVMDLAFSIDGSMMFSGGGECTLVKWDVQHPDNKRTLPRMGLPIRHIAVSPANTYISISHADNSIQLVNNRNEVVQTIQNITQCYVPEDSEDINASETSLGGSWVYRAGLHIDPSKQSLVMNGKPGRLQCYSFKEDKHLYSLDISQQNYITSERNRPIPNVDVILVAFSKNGAWLATGETRFEDSACMEIRLKFWKFDAIKQKFILNTSIEWPHEQGMIGLKIQPVWEGDENLIAATSGCDNRFKTWGIVHDPSIHGKSEWWNCDNVGTFRGLPAGELSFSSDGSLLAVAFGRVLTLWESGTHQLKLSLSHTKLQQNIRMVEFGANANSHLVICSTDENLIVWDIISSSLMWVAPFQAESIAVDPYSNLVSAFSKNHHLFFFRLDKSEPIAIRKNVSSCTVISSIFVPNPSQFEINGLKSTLIFINSSQELCALLSAEEEDQMAADLQLRIKGESNLSPFGQIKAENIIKETDKRNTQKDTATGGMPGYPVLRQIMDASPHTMPSVTYYATQLLQALSIRKDPQYKLGNLERAMEKAHISSKSNGWSNEDERKDDFQSEKKRNDSTSERFNTQVFYPDLDFVVNDVAWIDSVFSKN